MNIFRLLGRIFNGLLLLLLFSILIGEGIIEGKPDQYPFTLTETLLFICLFASMAGLLWAWRNEKLGGWLTVGGVLAFLLIDFIASGSLVTGWVFGAILLTGILFLISERRYGPA